MPYKKKKNTAFCLMQPRNQYLVTQKMRESHFSWVASGSPYLTSNQKTFLRHFVNSGLRRLLLLLTRPSPSFISRSCHSQTSLLLKLPHTTCCAITLWLQLIRVTSHLKRSPQCVSLGRIGECQSCQGRERLNFSQF